MAALAGWKGNVEQMVLEGSVDCDEFAPHPLRANFCTNCFKQIGRHNRDAIKDEGHMVRALEYGQKGERTPSAIFAPDATTGLGGLFLGGFKAVMNAKFLKSANVTAVVNCAAGLEIFGPVYKRAVTRAKASGIKFLELGWVDAVDQDVPREDLARAAAVIAAARSAGGSVVVHCAQGKSRSTTVVLAYVIALHLKQQEQGEGGEGGGGGGGGGDDQGGDDGANLPPLVPFHRRRSAVGGELGAAPAAAADSEPPQQQSSTAAAGGAWDFVRDGPRPNRDEVDELADQRGLTTLVDHALAWVRTKRRMASPNDGFMRQLRALEKESFFGTLLTFVTPPQLEDLFC